MDSKLLETLGGLMPEETHDLFLIALKHKLATGKYTQIELAEVVGYTPQHLNAVINQRENERGSTVRASVKLQRKIATAYEMGHMEFLALGKKLADGEVEQPPRPSGRQGGQPNEFVSYESASSMANELLASYKKMNDRLHLWIAVFEHLPVAALLIKDRIVVRQNLRSRNIGIATGGPLCESCLDGTCRGTRVDCAVRIALETGTAAEEVRRLDGVSYKVNAIPFFQNSHEYFLVTACVLEEVAE